MPSDEIFHPDLRRAARFLPLTAVPPRLARPLRFASRLMRDRSATRHQIDDRVSVLVNRPSGGAEQPRPAVLWIHGGGLLVGNAAMDGPLRRRLADSLGAVVVSVEYRLAPLHRFPAAVEDCHTALEWLARQSDVDESRIAVAGSSAGGGLAAATALLARERQTVTPAFQLLVYPMLDDRTAARADPTPERRRLWNAASNHAGWEAYLGVPPGSDGVSPLAAAARAEDLTGLPPAWIGVGTVDLFHDEDVAYAAALHAAGVPCELLVVEGAFHGFDAAGSSEVAQAFVGAQVEALRGALT